MKKREFLAMGGAMPLMLAGCGGNGSGSAPTRLVNASVGYPGAMGFMDESTQITTGITYGNASPYFNIEAGTVHLTLTTTVSGAEQAATAAQLRTVAKDQRYSLVAYGILDELRLALVAEYNTALDANTAAVNVLNTSADIGAVDVYLSPTKSLSISTQIASNVLATSTSPQQSQFALDIQPGSYYITVVGAGSVAENISDVRFQTPSAIALASGQVMTVILTPGTSGVLANAILLTQGTQGTAVSYLNTTARVRAVTAISGTAVSVVGTNSTGTSVTVLPSNSTPKLSNYFVVTTGNPPVVTVGGVALDPATIMMDDPTSTAVPPAQIPAKLAAGGDYTLMVYLNGSTPTAKLVEDNNTAPVTAAGVKFRLINLASDNQGLEMSMTVNGSSVASNIPYATASSYTEVPNVPQTFNSTVKVVDGAAQLTEHVQVLPLGNIFTDIVVSVPAGGPVLDFFQAASGTTA
ncbi:DUF4397 domain-containing protein [Scleromatobacter humisilvae]|uniref:DUF4397 domain-containing protein n=1 Tax=Scleromatobacter humisilvae TaxID=2897159 RepID=A0A9X1YKC9_9BURK|nr:DUF4397 domain-containing protein [Scleromatobacter humisilvae]MCK9687521.1 DUF4397 domain-containing protein [Scleromatobacter humisilvae]